MADDNMYLENLKEFVNDEEKIVTYKWLSRTLSVNVNQAKQMLYAFVQHQQKDKNDGLSIVYIVGGIIKTGDGSLIQKYLFAHEKDLEDIKQCYDQLTSLHIYSVQKTNPKDSNVLYMADYDLQKENLDSPNRWSSITCKFAAKHVTESQDTHDNNREKEETEKSMSNGFHKKPNQVTQEQLKPVASTSTKNTKSKVKPSKKKGDVASFFARQAASNKKETQKVESLNNRKDDSPICEKLSEKEKEIEQNNDDATSDDKIINKEEKETEATEKDDKNKELKTSNDDKKIETIPSDAEEFKTISVNREESSNSKKKSSVNQGETKTEKTHKEKQNDKEKLEKGVKRSKTKKLSKEKKDEHDDENNRKRKRRKRVKEFCDSSEEEVESPVIMQSGSSGDTTPIPDQQPQEPINKTESQKVRRRKRVLKSKTYLNDEGYMVTEKVYESESTDGSANEKEASIPEKVNENKPAVKMTKASPKKKPVKIATKQASLTSFFKRS